MRRNIGIVLSILFFYWIASCNADYFVFPYRYRGVQAGGSLADPYDNILWALNQAKNAGGSHTIYLLYGNGSPHYLLLYEPHPYNTYYDLRSYGIGSGTRSGSTLIELNGITIRPLYCDETSSTYANPTYCTTRDQRIQIFAKTTEFIFWVRGYAYFQNIILDGVEDIKLWNSATTAFSNCAYDRVRCCYEQQQVNGGVNCVTSSQDYSGLSLSPTNALFSLDSSNGWYSTIQLTFDNTDVKNFVSPHLTSLIQTTSASFTIIINKGASSNMFFDRGLIYHTADSAAVNASSVDIRDFTFTGYNYWTLFKTTTVRKEGYLFYTNNLYSGKLSLLRSNFKNITTSVRSQCYPLTTTYFTAPMNNKLLSQARSRSNLWSQFHKDHLNKNYMSSLISIKSFAGGLSIADSTFQNIIGTSGSVIHVDDTPTTGTWFTIYRSYFDNNYAYDGFANIVIAKSTNGAFSRMLACPHIEIVNTEFTNAYGCPGSYGNVASICYWDTTPTESSLSSYSIGTTAAADYNDVSSTYTLLPDFWVEQNEKYSYVRVKNSLFENNQLSLSNSLAIVGGYFNILENNIFQNNGGMNQDYLPARFNGSYFATRHPTQVPTDYTTHFGQTTAVFMDHIVKLTSRGNTFTNNWCSWEGSIILAYSLTIKSWIKVQNSLKFDGDTFTKHNGLPTGNITEVVDTTDPTDPIDPSDPTNTTDTTNSTNTTTTVDMTRLYLAPVMSFSYDSKGSNALMQDTRWTIGKNANIRMNGVTLSENTANYDYSNYTGGEGELTPYLEIIIASKRRFSTGIIKFAFNYEAEDIVVNVLNIDAATPTGGKAGFSFTNGEISKNMLYNDACMFPTAWAESFNLDTVKIYNNTVFPSSAPLDQSSSVSMPILTKPQQVRNGMFCVNALETLQAVKSVRLSVNRASINNNTGILFLVYPSNSAYLSISNSLFVDNVCNQASIITVLDSGNLLSINNIFMSNTNPLGIAFATSQSNATSIFSSYLKNMGVHASILYLNGGGSSCSYEIGARIFWNDINPTYKILSSALAPQGGLYFQSSSCMDFGVVDFRENPAFSGLMTNFESKTRIYNGKITNHIINGTSVIGNFVYLSKLKMKDVDITNAEINRVPEIPIKQAGIAVLFTSDIDLENVNFNNGVIGSGTNVIYGNSMTGTLTNIGVTNCQSATDVSGILMDFISSTLVIKEMACSEVTSVFSLMSSEIEFETLTIAHLRARNGKQSIINMADTNLKIKDMKYSSDDNEVGSLLPLIKGDNDYIQIENAQFLGIPDSQTKLFDLKNSKQLFVTNCLFDYVTGPGLSTVFDVSTPDFASISKNVFKLSGRSLRVSEAQGLIYFISNIILTDSNTVDKVTFEDNRDMYILDNTFSYTKAVRDTTLLQAPLEITNCQGAVQLNSNSFISLNGYNGVVQIEATEIPFNVTAKSNTFINNMGSNGGGIYLLANKIWSTDVDPVALIEDSVFIMNQAKSYRGNSGRGGAIHVASPGSTMQNVTVKNTMFVANTADRVGGAIYYDYAMPDVGSDSTFKENQAQRLNHIASYPLRLVQLDLDNPINITYVPNDEPVNVRHEVESYKWKDIPSGIQSDRSFIFALLDVYGQVVYDDDTSVLELSTSALPANIWNVFSSVVTLTSKNGLFNFTNFKFSYKVAGNISLTYTTTAISNQTAPPVDNLTFIPTAMVNVSFRTCDLGEFISEQDYGFTVCQKCQPSFWQLTPASAEATCMSCDETTTRCLGGNKVGPKPGYWRMNATADMVLRCPNQGACLGNPLAGNDPNPQLSLTGECAEGYTGNVCGNCKSGYGRSSSGSCEKCSQKMLDYVIFFGLKIISLILIFKQVKSIMELVQDYRNKNNLKLEIAVLMRVLSNYIQFVSVISTMNISWPNVMGDALSSGSSVSVPANEVLSVECFFHLPENKADSQLIFYNVLFTNVTPVVLSILAVFFWLGYFLHKKRQIWRNKKLVNYLIMTTVVIFFNLLPSAITQTFSLFQCANLYRKNDPAYYLKADYDITCWQGNHLYWTLGFSIPSILIWVVGFPLWMLFILVKNKNKLNEDKIVQRYLFLYVGYKDDKYYWEFVILARKILLIFSSVIASLHSVNLQIYFSVCLTIAAYSLQLKYNPYSDDRFNTLEAVSLLSSALINFGGLYFQVIDRDSGIDIVLLIASLLGAVYFFMLFLRLFLGMQIRILLNNPLIKKIGKALCCCINFDNLEEKLGVAKAMGLIALKGSIPQSDKTISPHTPSEIQLQDLEIPECKEDEKDDHQSPKKLQTKSSLRFHFAKLPTKDVNKLTLELNQTDELSPRLSVSARELPVSPFYKTDLKKQMSHGGYDPSTAKAKRSEKYLDKTPVTPIIQEDPFDVGSPNEHSKLKKRKEDGSISPMASINDWSAM